MTKKFKQYIAIIGIIIKNAIVEANYAIIIIERFYKSLQ